MKITKKTLFIGLGGTGVETCSRLIKENEQYANSNLVKFVLFDFGLKEDNSRSKKVRKYFYPLNQSDTVDKVSDLKLQGNKDYYHWFPDKENKYINERILTSGAGQWRPVGRVSYYVNREMIESTISEALAKLEQEPITYDQESGIDINLVGSIAGGTGSGLFLDVAYYLARKNKRNRYNTYAFLLLPGVFRSVNDNDNVDPNSYAALKEINAFFKEEKDFTIMDPPKGESNELKSFTFKAGKHVALTRVFLFDNQVNKLLNAENTYDYMARVLSIRTSTSIPEIIRTQITNGHHLDTFSYAGGFWQRFPKQEAIENTLRSKAIVHSMTGLETSEVEGAFSGLDGQLGFLQTVSLKTPFLDKLAVELQSAVAELKKHGNSVAIEELKKIYDFLEKHYSSNLELFIAEEESQYLYLSDDLERARHKTLSSQNSLGSTLSALYNHHRILTELLVKNRQNEDNQTFEVINKEERLFRNTIESGILKNYDSMTKNKYAWPWRTRRKKGAEFAIIRPLFETQISKLEERLNILLGLRSTKKNQILTERTRQALNLISKESDLIKDLIDRLEKAISDVKTSLISESQNVEDVFSIRSESDTEVLKIYLDHLLKGFNDQINEATFSKTIFQEIKDGLIKGIAIDVNELINRELKRLGDWINNFIKDHGMSEEEVMHELVESLSESRPFIFQKRSNSPSYYYLFWAAPKGSKLDRVDIQTTLGDSIKSVFPNSRPKCISNEIGEDSDRFLVYFESHNRPAMDIALIDTMQEEYLSYGKPRALLHIDKNYVRFPDLLDHETVQLSQLCGNPGCDYDISSVPHNNIFCPSCTRTILNRCGNEHCLESQLLSKLGGLKNISEKNVSCPTCNDTIKTFWARCSKENHKPYWRLSNKDVCPECQGISSTGLDERIDQLLHASFCINCHSTNRETKHQPAAPELYYDVPLNKTPYLNMLVEENGIQKNQCPECSSKLYPECPYESDELHFISKDQNYCHHVHLHSGVLKPIARCYNCAYPLPINSDEMVNQCPRCHSDLTDCERCSDINNHNENRPVYYVTPIVRGNRHFCPSCSYELEQK